MPTKNALKLRAKRTRYAAARRERDPEFAARQSERLARVRAEFAADPEKFRETRRRARKYAHLVGRAKTAAYKKAQQAAIAGRDAPSACEACGVVAKVVFDHDHATDKFRGWLCSGCNTALGYVRDRPDALRALAAYLDAFELQKATRLTISSQRKPRPRGPRQAHVTLGRDWLLVDSSFHGSVKSGALERFN